MRMYRYTVEYRRTAVIKLGTPEGADTPLRETVEQFEHCANTASEWCWHGDDGYHVTSKAKAERALYDQLRTDTELTANLVQKGIRQAVEAVKSGVERLKNGKETSCPTFTADTAVYDKRSATFHRDHVSLSTPDGRIECDYILPDDADTPPTKYVTNEDYEFRRATLHRRDGCWYLHASMLEEDDTDTTTEHSTVLGVNQLAVASTGRFWSADEFNHWKREYESGVATSSSVGHGPHTTRSQASSAKRTDASRYSCIVSPPKSWLKPSNTTARTSCSRT